MYDLQTALERLFAIVSNPYKLCSYASVLLYNNYIINYILFLHCN